MYWDVAQSYVTCHLNRVGGNGCTAVHSYKALQNKTMWKQCYFTLQCDALARYCILWSVSTILVSLILSYICFQLWLRTIQEDSQRILKWITAGWCKPSLPAAFCFQFMLIRVTPPFQRYKWNELIWLFLRDSHMAVKKNDICRTIHHSIKSTQNSGQMLSSKV